MDLVRTLEGRQQELRDAQNRLAEARAEQLKQEAEVIIMLTMTMTMTMTMGITTQTQFNYHCL